MMMVRDLRPLAWVVVMMVVIDAIWTPAILVWLYLFPASFTATVGPIADSVDGAALIFKFLTMIVFARWIYVAGCNLVARGVEDLEFSPGWRVGWFLVPILCLFKPFQGMRELWNASRGTWPYDQNDGLISTWWAIWLLSGVVSRIFAPIFTTPDSGSLTVLWIDGAFGIAAAALAIAIVQGISKAQSGFGDAELEEVFA